MSDRNGREPHACGCAASAAVMACAAAGAGSAGALRKEGGPSKALADEGASAVVAAASAGLEDDASAAVAPNEGSCRAPAPKVKPPEEVEGADAEPKPVEGGTTEPRNASRPPAPARFTQGEHLLCLLFQDALQAILHNVSRTHAICCWGITNGNTKLPTYRAEETTYLSRIGGLRSRCRRIAE